MNTCELRLINDYGVTVDRVDFLSEPFTLPFNLRIPKATKRIRETGENLFRDGTDLTSIRYNNAVVTLQPRLSFGCTELEALQKIEALRYQIDSVLEAARSRSLLGYGSKVILVEDTKGFSLQSNIIDGNFDIEDDWSGSNIAQGVIIGSSITLTRSPFRTALTTTTLENYVPNAGFETRSLPYSPFTSDPKGWTGTGMGRIKSQSFHHLKGTAGGKFTIWGSDGSNASIESWTFSLTANTLYYCEAWVKHQFDTMLPVTMQIIRISTMSAVDSITWNVADAVLDPYDRSAHRSHRQNTYDITTLATEDFSTSKYLIRKGFVFKPTASDRYFVRFVVTTPGAGNLGDIYIDRVYLTPAINMPYAAKEGDVLDPTVDFSYRTRFPVGWIAGRDIVNHSDDGMTWHGPFPGQSPQLNSLITDLVSHWKLDEESGTRYDSYLNGNNLASSGVGFASGKINNAAAFTAASLNYLSIAENSYLSVQDIYFTIGAWVYLLSKGANRTIVAKWNSSTNNREYMLWYDNANDRFAFSVSSDGTTVTTVLANNLGSPSTATWYYILAWHNPASNTINIRVNYGTVDSSAHSTGVLDGTSNFVIGATSVPGDYFDGRIDSVSFWKTIFGEHNQARVQNENTGNDFPFGLYHANYADILDVPGDLPALARLRLKNNDANQLKTIIASIRSYGTPAGQATMNDQTSGTGTADTEASGGTKIIQTGLSASFSDGADYSLAHTPAFRGNLTGSHHVVVRVKDTATAQGNLRLRGVLLMVPTGAPIYLTEVTPPSPGASYWSIADLGIINIPLISAEYGNIVSFGNPSVGVDAKRISGIDNVEYDFLALFPADEWFAVADCFANQWSTDYYLNFNSLPDLPSVWTDVYFGPQISLVSVPTRDVPKLGFSPGRENRAQFLWSRFSSPGKQHVLDDYLMISAEYLSRWL